jgi:hypothetical protein
VLRFGKPLALIFVYWIYIFIIYLFFVIFNNAASSSHSIASILVCYYGNHNTDITLQNVMNDFSLYIVKYAPYRKLFEIQIIHFIEAVSVMLWTSILQDELFLRNTIQNYIRRAAFSNLRDVSYLKMPYSVRTPAYHGNIISCWIWGSQCAVFWLVTQCS